MNCLILFAKDPLSRPVKTRLAKDIGENNARYIYEKILDHTINKLKSKKFDMVLYIDGNSKYFVNYKINIKKQRGNDLGERMFNAIKEELKKYRKVILIGSDIPGISKKIIKTALLKLNDHDIVIGPSDDGGYYLVGIKSLSNIFSLKKWSHPHVLEETVILIQQNNLKYCLVDSLNDIDTIDDLNSSLFATLY